MLSYHPLSTDFLKPILILLAINLERLHQVYNILPFLFFADFFFTIASTICNKINQDKMHQINDALPFFFFADFEPLAMA